MDIEVIIENIQTQQQSGQNEEVCQNSPKIKGYFFLLPLF